MSGTVVPPTEAPTGGPTRHRVSRAFRARRRRRLAVSVCVGAVTVGLALVALMVGEFPVSPGDALAVALGTEQGPARLVLVEFRLPRLLAAILVGMALGTAGALFQSVLRNSLASPDIIGISQGAAVGAVLAALGWGLAGLWISAAAWLGALVVAALNLALAWRGGLAGRRFVLCGIALSFACASVTSYLLARGDIREAHTVLLWLAGSVGSVTHDDLTQLGVVLFVLLPIARLIETRLAMLELGEDTAAGLGVSASRTRVVAIALAVGLAASAVAVAGPVGFVALTAGPIARRLVGDGKPALLASALAGAAVTLGADVTAQHLVPGGTVPVGVVTGLIGGPYLFWLLTQSRGVRRSS